AGRAVEGRHGGDFMHSIKHGAFAPLLALCAASGLAPASTAAQEESVGRGWPMLPYEAEFVGPGVPFYNFDIAAARGGEVPPEIEPLEHDIFTSPDFYLDRELWSHPRYFRCNSPMALDSQWGDYSSSPKMIENEDPATGAWGHCEVDYPRESIV